MTKKIISIPKKKVIVEIKPDYSAVDFVQEVLPEPTQEPIFEPAPEVVKEEITISNQDYIFDNIISTVLPEQKIDVSDDFETNLKNLMVETPIIIQQTIEVKKPNVYSKVAIKNPKRGLIKQSRV